MPAAKKLGLAGACIAGAMSLWLATPQASIPSDDDQYAPTAYVTIPNYPLLSFDISYVDVSNQRYLLADRSNQAIDVIDTKTNTFLHQFKATPAFAGVIPTPANPANESGPNGVISITGIVNLCQVALGKSKGSKCNPHQKRSLIWATDGPEISNSPLGCGKGNSSIKVLDLFTGVTEKVLCTNGIRRTDELCFNPDQNNPFVLVANDDPLDNFIQFWRWDTFELVETIVLDGTDPNASNFPAVATGIEQCQWNPRQGAFYLAIPTTDTESGDGSGNGYVLKIAQPTSTTPGFITDAFEIDGGVTGCAGPQGLAIGPGLPALAASTKGSSKRSLQSSGPSNGEIALGCGGTNSLIIDDFGNTVTIVEGVGGTDEAWYDPHSNHFFFADGNNAACPGGTTPCSAPGFLGIEDANGLPGSTKPPVTQIQDDEFTLGGLPTPDFSPTTESGSHSVAAYPGTCNSRSTQVYVPIRAFVPATATKAANNFGNHVCSTLAGGGNPNNNPQADLLGCIAIYTAPAACVSTSRSTNPPVP
jgi:hypothetical protein